VIFPFFKPVMNAFKVILFGWGYGALLQRRSGQLQPFVFIATFLCFYVVESTNITNLIWIVLLISFFLSPSSSCLRISEASDSWFHNQSIIGVPRWSCDSPLFCSPPHATEQRMGSTPDRRNSTSLSDFISSGISVFQCFYRRRQ
jgi:hypothetical protein